MNAHTHTYAGGAREEEMKAVMAVGWRRCGLRIRVCAQLGPTRHGHPAAPHPLLP